MRKIDDSGPKQDSEVKSVLQIRIRYPDIEDNRADPFMRHWIILSTLAKSDMIRIMRFTWRKFLLILVLTATLSAEFFCQRY